MCNWGLQGPPILVRAGKRDLVIASSKAGIVIPLDRRTGELVWKQPAGKHNGHDNDGLAAMRGDYSNLKTPLTAYPGGMPAAPSGAFATNVVNELILTATVDGQVYAFDTANGRERWPAIQTNVTSALEETWNARYIYSSQ